MAFQLQRYKGERDDLPPDSNDVASVLDSLPLDECLSQQILIHEAALRNIRSYHQTYKPAYEERLLYFLRTVLGHVRAEREWLPRDVAKAFDRAIQGHAWVNL